MNTYRKNPYETPWFIIPFPPQTTPSVFLTIQTLYGTQRRAESTGFKSLHNYYYRLTLCASVNSSNGPYASQLYLGGVEQVTKQDTLSSMSTQHKQTSLC